MKISTRGRYALRLMIELALNQDGDPVRIKDVAVRQDISAKYLEQIVSVLDQKTGGILCGRYYSADRR